MSTILAEQLSCRSELGSLRRRVDSAERAVDKWRSKATAFHKQLSDLTHVATKYITDVKERDEAAGRRVQPVKITRSVGLQVNLVTQQQQHPHQVQQAAAAVAAPAAPAKGKDQQPMFVRFSSLSLPFHY